ncbi:hypothetical protein ACFQY0_00355 [Haloferula chungangensis]|uniref:Uncharacterized protein n=1 Tax=Haloferula chungangensis TaxID=1048331 RepID=A0ABW2L310_9BACT
MSLSIALINSGGAELITRNDPFVVTQSSLTTYGLAMPFPSTAADTAVNEYSGQVVATYTFDSETLEFSSFTFANDNPQSYFEIYTRPEVEIPPPVPLPPVQNYKLEILTYVNYPVPGFNYALTYILREPLHTVGQNIIFRPQTLVPSGSITPSGALDNSEHVRYAYAGNLVTARAVTGIAQPPVPVNYAVRPEYLRMKGTYTPSISVVSSNLYYRSALAVLTVEMDESDPTTLPGSIPGLDLVINETEVGTFTANSYLFTIPTAYGQWSIDNDLSYPDPEDSNEAGIAYGILFALDLPASATALPITTEVLATGPAVQIALPDSGLMNPMSVEYSTTMEKESWSQLPAEYYLDGADSLDLGQTGAPRFGFPAGERGFLRFVTTIEP